MRVILCINYLDHTALMQRAAGCDVPPGVKAVADVHEGDVVLSVPLEHVVCVHACAPTTRSVS